MSVDGYVDSLGSEGIAKAGKVFSFIFSFREASESSPMQLAFVLQRSEALRDAVLMAEKGMFIFLSMQFPWFLMHSL